MKKITTLALVAICGALDGFTATPTTGVAYYVNAVTGSDFNSGTSESSAKKTIQAAIDLSSSGDTIFVATGSYAPITTGNKAIVIKSLSGAADTIIDGGGTNRCAYLGEMAGDILTVLDGFTLANGRVYISWIGIGGAGVRGGTVKNCVIRDCKVEGAWGGYGGEGGGAWGCRLERCEIKGCSAIAGGGLRDGVAYGCVFSGNYAHDDGGAMHRSLAINCLIKDNLTQNVGGGGSGGAGADVTNINCTIVNNCAASGGIFAGTSLLENCIIYGNSYNGGSLSHENIEQHTSMINCYTGFPGFVDLVNGDYRLATGSPCIDAGDNLYVMNMSDLDGNVRIANGVVDVGCYEYGSAPVWYVNGEDGSDANSGKSESDAKATIQAAVNASADGDTILVAPGSYGLFASSNKQVVVKGMGGAHQTVIDRLEYCSEDGVLRLAEYFDSELHSAVTNTVLEGFAVQGLASIFGGTLKCCIVRDNDTWSLGGAAFNYGVAENCLFLNNRGMNGAAADGCILKGCTMVGNSARDIDGVCMNSVLENCIVYGNGNDERSTWQYWFECNPMVFEVGHREKNVYVGDPGFVDVAKGDYHLAAGSPCIGNGDNSCVTSKTDLDGNARIIGGSVDIGCYEHISFNVGGKGTVVEGGGKYVVKVHGNAILAENDFTFVVAKEAYIINIAVGGKSATVALKSPEVRRVRDNAPYQAGGSGAAGGEIEENVGEDTDDSAGVLASVEDIVAKHGESAIKAKPTPKSGETVGALPVKTYEGLYYQAAWGDDLDTMTQGEKVQATGDTLYLGVIKQKGSKGFYKITVSE